MLIKIKFGRRSYFLFYFSDQNLLVVKIKALLAFPEKIFNAIEIQFRINLPAVLPFLLFLIFNNQSYIDFCNYKKNWKKVGIDQNENDMSVLFIYYYVSDSACSNLIL